MLLSIFPMLLFLFYNCNASVTHGKHVIVNGSLEKVQLNNDTIKEEPQIKRVNPPPIVEVIHGKVNSVVHEIRGSIDDIPPLLNDVKSKDDILLPTNLKHNTVTYELTESEHGGSGSADTVLNEVLLTRAASELIENSTAPTTLVIGPSDNINSIPGEPPNISQEVPLKPVPVPPPAPVLTNGTTNEDQPHDDIPSFSEWAKKQIAEAEKNKGENLTVGTVKVRLKNYASPDCGAKVVASNAEAVSAGAILSPSRDDYMLNACKDKIWFVVELCEAIQPQRIEIGNFELFSSSPKEFSVWVSDRHPTREWSLVSAITAKDERTVQSFPLPQLSHFAKYVKVELHSHYGTEHYCPISLFKAFGTSELEVLDNVDNDVDEEEDDQGNIDSTLNGPYDEDEVPIGQQIDHLADVMSPLSSGTIAPSLKDIDSNTVDGGGNLAEGSIKPATTSSSGNLLGTAKAAVLSIVKKAAEVLVKSDGNNGTCDKNLQDGNRGRMKLCVTPAYLIVCINCTDEFYNSVYGYLSCSAAEMEIILSNSFVHHTLINSKLCTEIGLNLGPVLATNTLPSVPVINKSRRSVRDPQSLAVDYLQTFLHDETTAALCNYLAISERKVLLNTSQHEAHHNELPTPKLTTLPVPVDVPNSFSIDPEKPPSDVTPELLSTEGLPGQTLVNSITPTNTLPHEIDFITLELNDTEKQSVLEQPHMADENATSTGATAEEIISSTTAAMAPSTVQSSLSAQLTTPPPDPSGNQIKDEKEINETEKPDTQIPSPQQVPLPSSVPVVIQDEVVDPLTLASLFPELEEEGTGTEPAATKTPSNSQTSSTQKESVFVRLANRIKALEMNMSLSGQYLEELSRRYKKQVEELQRTLSSMAEKENLQAAQISSLTAKVDSLTAALTELISEKDKPSLLGQHSIIIVVEVFVFIIVVAICRWVGTAKGSNTPHSCDRRLTNGQLQPMRRHSMDNVDGPSAPKIRRPSEEACLSAGTTHKELLVDGVKRKTSKEGGGRSRRKRRRKERWGDEENVGILVIGADGEETKWQPHITTSTATVPPTVIQPDYNVKTALWSRAKRTSAHTQTVSSSQDSVYTNSSALGQYYSNSNSSSTITTISSSTTATTTAVVSGTGKGKSKKSNSSGGTIKKIVKKFF